MKQNTAEAEENTTETQGVRLASSFANLQQMAIEFAAVEGDRVWRSERLALAAIKFTLRVQYMRKRRRP